MKEKPADLTTMGGRLQHTIEVLSGRESLSAFFNDYKNSLGMVEKTLYNMCGRKKLAHNKLQIFSKLIPGFSFEYVIKDDQTQKPEIMYERLQINTNKEQNCVTWKIKVAKLEGEKAALEAEIKSLNKMDTVRETHAADLRRNNLNLLDDNRDKRQKIEQLEDKIKIMESELIELRKLRQH